MDTRSSVVSVRDAKNRFSEMVRRAANGERITILSHGQPKALLTAAASEGLPLNVDWDWLRTMGPGSGRKTAEQVVRDDRDGRD